MLKVYVTDCTFLKEPSEWERQLKRVSPERAKHICSFHSADDRRRSLAASLLLRVALAQEGMLYENVHLVHGAHGKPFLQEGGIYFNLSHGGERALCAIADREVGADVEKLLRFHGKEERLLGIVRRCLNEKEQKIWKQSEYPEEELVRIWTRKESYVKMTGEGLSRDFTTVDTLEGFFEQRILPGGYCATVCTREDCGRGIWQEVRWDAKGQEELNLCMMN